MGGGGGVKMKYLYSKVVSYTTLHTAEVLESDTYASSRNAKVKSLFVFCASKKHMYYI